MSLTKLYQQVKQDRLTARTQAAKPPAKSTTAPKLKEEWYRETIYVSWVDVVEYDPEPKRERLLNLSEEQLDKLREEVSELLNLKKSTPATTLETITDYGHRTLGLSFASPSEPFLRKALKPILGEEIELGGNEAILLIEQKGEEIPVGEGPSLSVDALWSVQVIPHEGDAVEVGLPVDEEYELKRLNDGLALKNALLFLYSQSAVTAAEGIRLVDAEILPENELKLVFLGKPGTDVARAVRHLTGSGGGVRPFMMDGEDFTLHEPHFHLHEDDQIEVAFDEEEETKGSFNVSLPKGSLYLPPAKKPAAKKA